ncbi:SAVED domain-containing protein [Thermogemmatispora carboxidivorans]|uniref:SAVED domain-containing protein n=1 Tax=Thermogemmatispora carboxidivorans TaxID=1382306 RepID=UPI0006996287|nr:SAVED domain-containing protein [Thermogemmatispora carboxidivorans]
MEASQSTAREILCLYAIEDKRGFEELSKHLYNLNGIRDIQNTPPGKPPKQEQSKLINQAKLIIMLISPDLLSSLREEASTALKQAKEGNAELIPILYKTVDLGGTDLAELQLLPRNGEALAQREGDNRNKAWKEIAQEIRKIWEALDAGSGTEEKEKTTVNAGQSDAHRSQQQEQDPTRPATVFISSAGDAGKNREQLELMLRLRGLKLWHRDSEDLPFLGIREKATERAVSELADAYLLYLTPEALKKPQLWPSEARAALQRQESEPEFPIVLILQGVSRKRVQSALAKIDLEKLTSFIGSELEPEVSQQEVVSGKLRSLARKILREAFRQRRVRAGENHEIWIGLRTFVFGEGSPRLDLSVDARKLFLEDENRNVRRVTPVAEWRNLIVPALEDIEGLLAVLGLDSRGSLKVPIKAALSLDYLFGFIFRSVRLEVRDEKEGQYWDSKGPQDDSTPLKYDESIQEGDPRTAIVAISISNNIENDLNLYMQRAENRINYSRFIHYWMPEGVDHTRGVRDGSHALAIARQIGRDLRRLRSQGITHIHLFSSLPAGLAVLIGQQFNANVFGPISLYDFFGDQYHYVFTLNQQEERL